MNDTQFNAFSQSARWKCVDNEGIRHNKIQCKQIIVFQITVLKEKYPQNHNELNCSVKAHRFTYAYTHCMTQNPILSIISMEKRGKEFANLTHSCAAEEKSHFPYILKCFHFNL